MLYEPNPWWFDTRTLLGEPLREAAFLGAAQFLAGAGKPWAYYLGVFTGRAAIATSIPGLSSIIYVIGDTIDFHIFKSPDGAEVRWYLNGIQQSSIDTYAVTSAWEVVQAVLSPDAVNEITFELVGASAAGGATGIPWLALSNFIVSGTNPRVKGLGMAHFLVSFSITDSDADQNSLTMYVPEGTLTLAQIKQFATLAAPEVDAVTEGQITGINITLEMDLPGGLKASPVAYSENQKGGLFSFNTETPYRHSVRVPAFKKEYFVGKEIDVLGQTDVQDFRDIWQVGLDVNGDASLILAATDKYDNAITTIAKAIKSFRK